MDDLSGEAADTYALTINGVAIISSADLSAIHYGHRGSCTSTMLLLTWQTLGWLCQGIRDAVTLTAADGRNVKVVETVVDANGSLNTAHGFAGTAGTAAGTSNSIQYANITLTAGETITINGTQETDAGFTNGQTSSATGTAIGSGSIATLSGAQTMITSIDNALTTVNGGRADLGALQARFESVANTLSVSAETAAAARSRVQDADCSDLRIWHATGYCNRQVSQCCAGNAMPQQVLALSGKQVLALLQ